MGPRLTMSLLMQSRASFSNGKAVGMDDVSLEIMKALPRRAVQKISLHLKEDTWALRAEIVGVASECHCVNSKDGGN